MFLVCFYNIYGEVALINNDVLIYILNLFTDYYEDTETFPH